LKTGNVIRDYLQSSTRREPRISDMKGGGRLLDADCIFAYQVETHCNLVSFVLRAECLLHLNHQSVKTACGCFYSPANLSGWRKHYNLTMRFFSDYSQALSYCQGISHQCYANDIRLLENFEFIDGILCSLFPEFANGVLITGHLSIEEG
jgi:hypothetical protein